jgi:ATP-dependent protease ClpP protease subunit
MMSLRKRENAPKYYKLTKSKKMKPVKKQEESESDSENEQFDFKNIASLFSPNMVHQDIFTKANHIWFNTDVTKKSTNALVRIIYDKNLEYTLYSQSIAICADTSPKPLYLHINSYGGDLIAVMAVVDAIVNSKIPIYTIVEGCAASAATLMSMVGSKRYITKNSYMLIHQLSSGFYGKMNEMEEEMVNNKEFMKKLENLYSQYTKMSRNKIKEALKHDLWWDSDMCIKTGLVDEVYSG